MRSFVRRIPFEVWLVALVLIVHLYPVFTPANSLVMGWFGSDDAFYYFKTAQNITEGRGITFDGLGRDSGFHPLWMLVITPIFALARFDRVLPLRLVVAVSALLSAGTGMLLYRLARRSLAPLAAVFVALFWIFYPLVHKTITQMGMESAISAFFIVLLIYHVAQQAGSGTKAAEPVLAGAVLRAALVSGIIGIMAVFARLDNIFLVLLVGVWYGLRPVRMRYLLLSDVGLIALGALWSFMERAGFGAQFTQNAPAIYWMVLLALAIRVVLYYFTGLYRAPGPGWKDRALYLTRAVAASLVATALISGAMLVLQGLHVFPGFPRLTLAYEAGAGMASVLVVRLAAMLLASQAGASPSETIRWRPTLLRLCGFFAPLVLGLVVYMGLSQWYYGTPMPVSGQIKRWWGTLPNTVYGQPVESLAGMLSLTLERGPWELFGSLAAWPQALPGWLRLPVYGGVTLALILLLWDRSRAAIHRLALFPLFAGSFVQLISYTGTGYLHMREWYWAGNMLVITLLLGIALDNLLCLVERSTPHGISRSRYARPLGIILCVLVVLYGAEEIVRRMPMQLSARMQGYYLESIHELEANTEPGSLIGSTGGGMIAYFIKDRTVVNLDGLMNTTEYFHLLQQGKAAQYLDRIGLDYVSASELVITDSDPYFQFKGRLKKLKNFGGATLFEWQAEK